MKQHNGFVVGSNFPDYPSPRNKDKMKTPVASVRTQLKHAVQSAEVTNDDQLEPVIVSKTPQREQELHFLNDGRP